jgi:hypothetical protein
MCPQWSQLLVLWHHHLSTFVQGEMWAFHMAEIITVRMMIGQRTPYGKYLLVDAAEGFIGCG